MDMDLQQLAGLETGKLFYFVDFTDELIVIDLARRISVLYDSAYWVSRSSEL